MTLVMPTPNPDSAAELALERKFFSAVLDNIADGIVACDANGHLTVFNKATRVFHGLPAEIMSMDNVADYYDLYHADGVTKMKTEDIPLFRALRGDVVEQMPMIIAPKNGKKRYLTATGHALHDDEGQIIGAVVAMNDVTEQTLQSKQIRQQEKRFRAAFDVSLLGTALVSPEGQWLDVNTALCDMLAYSKEELLYTDFQSLTHPDDKAQDERLMQAFHEGKIDSIRIEKRFVNKHGAPVRATVGIAAIRNQQGKISYFVSQVDDVTQQYEMQEALKQSEALNRAIFQGQHDAIFVTDNEWRILETNAAIDKLFAYDPRSLIGRKMWVLYGQGVSHQEFLHQLQEPGRKLNYELMFQRKDGSNFIGQMSCTQLDEINDQKGYIWVVRDISQRKQAAEELAASQRRLAESREEERRRLARELHDGTVQDLIAMSYRVAQLEHLIKKGESVAAEALQSLRQDLTGTVKQVRGFISDLRPAGLDEFGIAASVDGYLSKLERNHQDALPKFKVEIDRAIENVNSSVTLCLFRAMQEAVMNAIKHAKAENIRIRIQKLDEEAQLIVEDDGKGFEIPQDVNSLTQDYHFGLAGLAERVELMSGHLSIHSQLNMGTEVLVMLPLDETTALDLEYDREH